MSGHDEGKKEPILAFRDYPRGSSKKKNRQTLAGCCSRPFFTLHEPRLSENGTWSMRIQSL